MQQVPKKFDYSLGSDCFSSGNRKEMKGVAKIICPRILHLFVQYCLTGIFSYFLDVTTISCCSLKELYMQCALEFDLNLQRKNIASDSTCKIGCIEHKE